jgi:hypothetical protein
MGLVGAPGGMTDGIVNVPGPGLGWKARKEPIEGEA